MTIPSLNSTATVYNNITLDYNATLVASGFWRSAVNVSSFPCPYGSITCAGGSLTDIGDDLCVSGFGGPFCGQCDDYYTSFFTVTDISCQTCSPGLLAGKTFLILPLFVIIPFLIYWYLGRGDRKTDKILDGRVLVGSLPTYDTSTFVEEGESSDTDHKTELKNGRKENIDYLSELAVQGEVFNWIGMFKLVLSSLQITAVLPSILGLYVNHSASGILQTYGVVSCASLVFYPINCITQALTLQMTTACSSLCIGVLYAALYILFASEKIILQALKDNNKLESFKLALHKINLKYTTVFFFALYIAMGCNSYEATQSLPCIHYESIGGDPIYVVSFDPRTLCDSSYARVMEKWAKFSFLFYTVCTMSWILWKQYKKNVEMQDFCESRRLIIVALTTEAEGHYLYLSDYVNLSKIAKSSLFSEVSLLQFWFSQYRQGYNTWEVVDNIKRLFFLSYLPLTSFSNLPSRRGPACIASAMFLVATIMVRPHRSWRNNLLNIVIDVQVFIITLSVQGLSRDAASSMIILAGLMTPIALLVLFVQYKYIGMTNSAPNMNKYYDVEDDTSTIPEPPEDKDNHTDNNTDFEIAMPFDYNNAHSLESTQLAISCDKKVCKYSIEAALDSPEHRLVLENALTDSSMSLSRGYSTSPTRSPGRVVQAESSGVISTHGKTLFQRIQNLSLSRPFQEI